MRQTNLNYSELKRYELYLLTTITDEEMRRAVDGHTTDPKHWASPLEVEARIDHDLFEE